jgi:hypothetical protein
MRDNARNSLRRRRWSTAKGRRSTQYPRSRLGSVAVEIVQRLDALLGVRVSPDGVRRPLSGCPLPLQAAGTAAVRVNAFATGANRSWDVAAHHYPDRRAVAPAPGRRASAWFAGGQWRCPITTSRLLICRCSSVSAGGYTARATDEYVLVTRNGEQRKALPNTPIQPDDVIRVPERNF